jgi:hypothetical protein
MFGVFMSKGIPCGLQCCSKLVRVVIKKDDGLNVVTINISYMSCLPDVIRRTRSLMGGAYTWVD